MHLLDRQLIFVTGKGGVGKTTIAAGIARVAARTGRRTLIVEMDAKGDVARAVHSSSALGFVPGQLGPNLWAMAMNTEDSLRDYLRLYLRIPLVDRLGALANAFDFVANAAPGVKEILAVGKVCYEVRERTYDLVVVDAEASGHVVAQIGAPMVMREMVALGPILEQTGWMSEILCDPQRTAVVAVTTPEEMAIAETVELRSRLRAEAGVELSMLVVNRVLPALFDRRRRELLERIAPLIPAEAGWGQILDAAVATERRRLIGSAHLEDVRDRLGDLDRINIPEVPGSGELQIVLDAVGEALAGELDVEL